MRVHDPALGINEVPRRRILRNSLLGISLLRLAATLLLARSLLFFFAPGLLLLSLGAILLSLLTRGFFQCGLGFLDLLQATPTALQLAGKIVTPWRVLTTWPTNCITFALYNVRSYDPQSILLGVIAYGNVGRIYSCSARGRHRANERSPHRVNPWRGHLEFSTVEVVTNSAIPRRAETANAPYLLGPKTAEIDTNSVNARGV